MIINPINLCNGQLHEQRQGQTESSQFQVGQGANSKDIDLSPSLQHIVFDFKKVVGCIDDLSKVITK